MQQNLSNIFERTPKYSIQRSLSRGIELDCKKSGLVCSKCSHCKSHKSKCRQLHECVCRGHKICQTVGTNFKHSQIPLTNRIASVYLMGTNKDEISANRFSNMVHVKWRTTYRKLKNPLQAMGNRNLCHLSECLFLINDSFIYGCRFGKRGGVVEGKKTVLFALELRKHYTVCLAVSVFNHVNSGQVLIFLRLVSSNSEAFTDELNALCILFEMHEYVYTGSKSLNPNDCIPKSYIPSLTISRI